MAKCAEGKKLTSCTMNLHMSQDRVKRFGWARARDAYAIYLAARDPRVPWDAKALAFLVAAYLLSPIDLIPDFIPILGYGDDLIIVALGALAVAQLVPPDIMSEHRATAERVLEAR
jgi:uncharacterized membrane protein YkvA (DUF1232 family)